MKNVLVIGATSAIAETCATLYAEQGDNIYLLARNNERLTTMASNLNIRGNGQTHAAVLDVNDIDNHQSILKTAQETLGSIDIVLIAHGTLPDQEKCQQDFNVALQELNTNTISTLSLLTHLANLLEEQQSGTIAVISSVAGDRGRQSNYVYGAAKGAVSIFLQGLRNRLSKKGVNVLDIKPGFVDTPMTADFPKGALWAKPEKIAKDILKAIEKNKHTLYTPFFWRYIMLIIRSIPEGIFKKLSL